MKIIRGLVAVSLAAGVAPAAYAQDGAWYLGAQTGVNLLNDADTSFPGTSSEFEYDPGFGLLGQVGMPLGDFRVEAEIGWRRNSIDEFAGAGIDGDTNLFSFMANGYYDIPLGWRVTPYVGAGAGGAVVSVDADGIVDESEVVFAYQGIAGLSYKINDELAIKGDYRYLATEDFTVDGVESEYESHAFMVGFTYFFGAAAKQPAPAPVAQVTAPPPAPAPAPTNYLVFFDFDRADLTPEAQDVLRKAADAIKTGRAARVTLVGHADRSGTDRYNMGLSQRRGENVETFLAGLGVSNDVLDVVARGETSPLVPTPDGVREPQNRRVEIVLP